MEQKSTVLQLLALFCFSIVLSVPVSLKDDHVHVVLLSESPGQGRRERSAGGSNMPERLSFGVRMKSDEDDLMVLSLARSAPPNIMTSDDHSTKDANQVLQNAGVYIDFDRRSAMIVRRENGHYKLEGSFVYSDNEWNIQPSMHRDKRGTDDQRLHKVYKLKAKHENISLYGDEVTPPDERKSTPWPQHKVQTDSAEVKVQRLKAKYENISLDHDEVIPPSVELDKRDLDHGNHDNDINSRHRNRRAITNHVIELSFVVDFADWSKWIKFYSTDAMIQLKLWYTYVAELINIRFQSIQDPDISIRTKVTNIRVLTADNDDDFIQNLTTNGKFSGDAGLSSFSAWCKAGNIPKSDHYMLFTGFDINNAAGIAYSGRTCTEYGVSITENSFDGTVGGVAAHELGHSLSASHDAQTNSVCTDDRQFIMSTVFQTPVRSGNEGNPWKFSQCSIQAFKTYLSTQTCTLTTQTSSTDVLPAPGDGQRAGEVLSRDAQCRLNFRDNSSSYCDLLQISEGGEALLCGGMYCSIPNDKDGYCETTVPQEYTVCGTNKWCIAGVCVQRTTSTSTTSTTTTTPTTTTTTTTSTTTTTRAPTTTTATPTTTTISTTTTTKAPTTTTTTPTTTPTSTTTSTATTTTTPITTTTTTPTTTTTTKAPTTTTTTTITYNTTTTPTTTSTATTTTKEPTTTTTTTLTTNTTTTPTTTTTTTPTTTHTTTTTTTYTTTTTPTSTTTMTPTTTKTTPTSTPTTTTPNHSNTTATTTKSISTTTTKPTTSAPTTTTTRATIKPPLNPFQICSIYLSYGSYTKWWRCVK